MSESRPSAPARRLAAPGWLHPRLVAGVLLVLLSVVVGARVLAGADRSQLVWSTTRALAPGSVLGADDLVAVRVRLFDSAERYLDAAAPPPVGYVAARGLGAGELLPDQALRPPGEQAELRLVTVLVELGHAPPDLTDAQQVDVWVTAGRDATGGSPRGGSAAERVLEAVTVADVPAAGDSLTGSAAFPVVLQVRPADVGRLLSAVARGSVDLVRVPRSAETETAASGTG